jgi:hypothetical protein
VGTPPGPAAGGEPRPGTGFDWFGTVAGRQTLLVVGVAIALVIGILVAGSNSSSGATPKSGQIFLDAANSAGTNAFTPSVAKAFAVGAATTTTAPPASTTVPSGVASVSGDTVGLYGGTLNLSSCNAQQMVRYLLANSSLGQAWAQAEGIPYAGLAAYIDSLTPVILRGDTQVTNHGYVNGYATPHQSVLQAGTAVLVDNYGIPRARCYCGNPLTPPVATTVTPQYVGPQWPTFSPTTVVVVVPPPAPLNTITLVDTNTGQTFTRPVGTAGSSDQPTSSTSSASSTTTTTTAPPTPTGTGTVYSFSLSNGQLSGSTGGQLGTSADCDTALVNAGLTDFQGTAYIQGNTLALVFSNIALSGSYDPSNGNFSVTGSAPVSKGGVSGTAAFTLTGALGPQSISGGMFAETVTPPGAICTYPMAGDRALNP